MDAEDRRFLGSLQVYCDFRVRMAGFFRRSVAVWGQVTPMTRVLWAGELTTLALATGDDDPRAALRAAAELRVGQVSGREARLVRRARNQGLSWAGFAPDEGAAAVVMSNTARSVDRLGLQLLSQCRRDGSDRPPSSH